MTEWIKCSERMPKDEGVYIVCKAGDIFTAKWEKCCNNYYQFDFNYYPFNPSECLDSTEITHWSELPEAPHD